MSILYALKPIFIRTSLIGLLKNFFLSAYPVFPVGRKAYETTGNWMTE